MISERDGHGITSRRQVLETQYMTNLEIFLTVVMITAIVVGVYVDRHRP